MLESFRLYHFQDIKVATVAKIAGFQTLSLTGYKGCMGCKGCKISDFIIVSISGFRGLQRWESSRLYHLQDIKVLTVPKVEEFQTLSFSGNKGCDSSNGCKLSDFII